MLLIHSIRTSLPLRMSAKTGMLRQRRIAPILGLLSVLLIPMVSCLAAEISKELQVKCSYLHNFTKFVEWPAETFSSDNSPLIIGICGGDGLRNELETQVRDRSLGKRKFQIAKVDKPEDIAGVHLLYISDAADPLCVRLIAAAASVPKLTVGDTDQFARSGGIIRFILEEGKVRFEINQATAEASQLKLSPQLLKLARVVRKK